MSRFVTLPTKVVKGLTQYERSMDRARKELATLMEGPLSQVLKVQIQKMNPYHDARGRFTHAHSAHSVSVGPVFEKQLAKLRAREAEAQKETFLGGTGTGKDFMLASQLTTDTEDQWSAFTTEEKRVVRAYTSDAYEAMNKRETLAIEMSDRMQQALMTKTSLPENVITYRMLNLGRKAGINVTSESDVETMRSFIGREFTDPDFGSTSTAESIAVSFRGSKNRVVMEIKVRKGAKGLPVESYERSANSGEAEIILPREAMYRITGVKLMTKAFSKEKMWGFEVEHLGP